MGSFRLNELLLFTFSSFTPQANFQIIILSVVVRNDEKLGKKLFHFPDFNEKKAE